MRDDSWEASKPLSTWEGRRASAGIGFSERCVNLKRGTVEETDVVGEKVDDSGSGRIPSAGRVVLKGAV